MFILALAPIIWLIVAMSVLKMAGWKACLIALVVTFVEAMAFWKMPFVFAATAVS